MNFKPSGTWIVLPDPVITETESGIILDEATAMENSKRSNVLEALAVGPNCHFVKKGDIVMVDPRSEAARTEIDGGLYLIISEHQILGKW
jgi:co-chaperonin GroES (HSP10)